MSRGMKLVALTAAVTIALPMAPAAADRGHDVPDQATIVITGNGSGHGRGMSQYGAYSAARQGKGYRAILGFYYPRTRWGKVGGPIEVQVSADDDGDVVVEDVDGLKVREVGSGQTHALDGAGTRWRIRDDGSGGSEVSSLSGGSWTTWDTYAGDVELLAGSRKLTLVVDDARVDYRGALRSSVDDFEDRVTVNVLPLEQYLRGVVPSEMPGGWGQQALRAQAVAARSYAAWRREVNPLDVAYDIGDTDGSQVYGGASAEVASADQAVRKTAKQVLTSRRKPIFAEYSASNGGHTVAGDKRYLPAKKDRFEGTSSDYYGWKRRVTAAELEDFYNLNNLSRIRIADRDGRGPWGGRVTKLELTTRGGKSPGTYSVDVERFRASFGLKSTLFTITKVD
jgi:stage II sporulation protein D